MYRFMEFINEKYDQNFKEYALLYDWSVENIPDFWASMWDFAEVRASQQYKQVVDDPYKMPGTRWFSGARLNFAENLLRYRDNKIALCFQGNSHILSSITKWRE